MSQKRAKKRKACGAVSMRGNRLVVAVTLALMCVFGSGILAQVNSRRPGKEAAGVSVMSLTPGSPSKEYVYAGARLIATEEPGGTQGTGAGGFDFGTDHMSDISIFRPSDGSWWILNPDYTQTVVGWGVNGDVIVPADYDGDGTCDIAVFRPSNGTWWIKPSSDPANYIYKQFAEPEDIPVPGDYDGDGKANIAVFRPSNGTWWVFNPIGNTQTVTGWGVNGDRPVPADYDGDGICDIAVFRPSNGTWWVIKSTGGDFNQQFAVPGDIPVPGDYDGDGKANIAVFRPSNGTWWILNPNNTQTVVGWGITNDIPVPTDYDGDGKCDIAVFRPSNGTWWIIKSSDPANYISQQFAVIGDIPVPSAYIRQ
jgi:hypothetical protein